MSQFALLVSLETQPEHQQRFLQLAEENAARSRQEPGCMQFDVLVDPQDPNQILLYEIYADSAAFEAHQQTAHFKDYLEHAVPLLAQRERRFLTRVAP